MKQKVLLLLITALFLASCSDNDKTNELPFCQAYITSYNEFGAAMLNLTQDDMTEAGFSLGDLISITVDDTEIVMPYYDGFYTRNAEYLCVAYPTYPSVCFTANNVGLPPRTLRTGGACRYYQDEGKGRLSRCATGPEHEVQQLPRRLSRPL